MKHVQAPLRGAKGSYAQVLDLAYPVVLSMMSWTVLWTVDTMFVGVSVPPNRAPSDSPGL